jgi:anaerobic selenocysteine-containing dehydrogenase
VRGLPEVRGELPVATLADEIETPAEGDATAVHALITIAGNPVLSTPDGVRLDRALAGLEFVVCVDPYRNETTRHAHVLLPPPSPLERPHYDLAFGGLMVQHFAKWSEPVFESAAMREEEILARLALIAAGQGAAGDPAVVDELLIGALIAAEQKSAGSPIAERAPAEIAAALSGATGSERAVDFLLRTGPWGDGFGADPDGLSLETLRAQPHGLDLGPLEPRLPGILETPSGRIELASEPIAGEIERVRAELALPEAPGLRLIGRRHLRSNNSWMHNAPSLMTGRDRCTLQIHPDDAAALDVGDGDSAEVTSRVGKLVARIELCDELLRGVVSLPHGWGHDRPGAALGVAAQRPGVNSNVLTDSEPLDALSGNAVLNGIPVTVRRT